MALERKDAHSHGVNASGHGVTDVAVAHDTDGLAGYLFNIEWFPAARLLIPSMRRKSFAK